MSDKRVGRCHDGFPVPHPHPHHSALVFPLPLLSHTWAGLSSYSQMITSYHALGCSSRRLRTNTFLAIFSSGNMDSQPLFIRCSGPFPEPHLAASTWLLKNVPPQAYLLPVPPVLRVSSRALVPHATPQSAQPNSSCTAKQARNKQLPQAANNLLSPAALSPL